MKSSKRALVPLAEGFEEVEATTIVDLLRRAGIEVVTAHLTSNPLVGGAHGIRIQAEKPIQSLLNETFDAIVLPGGMPGTNHLLESPDLRKLLLKHAASNALLAAICAAPIVLGAHGLLTGKSATCYPGFETKLGGAQHRRETVVEDGNVITSQGPATAVPFALALIRRLLGPEEARKVQTAVLA